MVRRGDFSLWVYPRVCGGTAGPDGVVYEVSGLSPRVRGNPYPADGYII